MELDGVRAGPESNCDSRLVAGRRVDYLDMLVYSNVPPGLLTACGVAVCLFNLGIYIARFGVGTLPAGKSDIPRKRV